MPKNPPAAAAPAKSAKDEPVEVKGDAAPAPEATVEKPSPRKPRASAKAAKAAAPAEEPEAKQSASIESIRERLLPPGGAARKPSPLAEAKPKVPDQREDDEDEDELPGARNGQADDDDDDQEEDRKSRRKPKADTYGRHNDEEDDDDLDDEGDEEDADRGRRGALSERTLEIAEELGYTRAEARREAREAGGEGPFLTALRIAARRLKERPRARQEADDEERPAKPNKSAPVDKSAVEAEFEAVLQDLQLEGEWDQPVVDLVGQLSKQIKTKLKAILDRFQGLDQRHMDFETRVSQREAAENTKQIDRLFSEAAKQSERVAEMFGSVPLRKLPKDSPLRTNREEVYDEMVAIYERRRDRGLEPLEYEDLFDRALAAVCPEHVEEKVERRLKSKPTQPRGTPVSRPNSRRNSIDDMPRGPERAARRLEQMKAEGKF